MSHNVPGGLPCNAVPQTARDEFLLLKRAVAWSLTSPEALRGAAASASRSIVAGMMNGNGILPPSSNFNFPPPRRTRARAVADVVVPTMRAARSRVNPMGRRRRKEHRIPTPIEEGTGLTIMTPRSPQFGSAGAGRQISPNFGASTRLPGGGWQPPGGTSLPPIKPGFGAVTAQYSPNASRSKQAISPYASAPLGLLPQLTTNGFPRSPISPTARYRMSPRHGSPPFGSNSSPPTLEGVGAVDGVGSTFFTKRLGSRSRGLDSSAQRLTFEIYGRIASPAKLHRLPTPSARRACAPPRKAAAHVGSPRAALAALTGPCARPPRR